MRYRAYVEGIVTAVLALGLSLAAYCQQALTVGDILAKGGKKLAKEEVTALYSGAIVSGVQSSTLQHITYKNLYSANGSMSGDAWDKGKWLTKVSGRWFVNDAGQYCSELSGSQGDVIKACGFYYTLDGHYYAGGSGEPSNKLVERKFERP